MTKRLGISKIASYIPTTKLSNYDVQDKFDIDENFIKNKIGVEYISRKGSNEDTSDLCVKAFNKLATEYDIDISEVECAILVTQNPDYNLPHTAGILHGKLGLPLTCATFDISLGCSGFVYALSIIESFMASNNMNKGLLFTSDPYSKIVNPDDKNTSLLFGDAATVSLISEKPRLLSGKFTFGTIGKQYEDLICRDGKLTMNGRAIFNFAARYIPKDIKKVLELNDLGLEEIDKFLFHQGSKYLVNTLVKRLKLNPDLVPFDISQYGNTVSSSIPLLLEAELNSEQLNSKLLISGFGVGLSWSSTILNQISN